MGALNAGIAPAFELPTWNRTDNARLITGTDAFKNALDKITYDPSFVTGAKIQDK